MRQFTAIVLDRATSGFKAPRYCTVDRFRIHAHHSPARSAAPPLAISHRQSSQILSHYAQKPRAMTSYAQESPYPHGMPCLIRTRLRCSDALALSSLNPYHYHKIRPSAAVLLRSAVQALRVNVPDPKLCANSPRLSSTDQLEVSKLHSTGYGGTERFRIHAHHSPARSAAPPLAIPHRQSSQTRSHYAQKCRVTTGYAQGSPYPHGTPCLIRTRLQLP